jgi:hypothetical protein
MGKAVHRDVLRHGERSREAVTPPVSSPDPGAARVAADPLTMLALQRAAGNRAVSGLMLQRGGSLAPDLPAEKQVTHRERQRPDTPGKPTSSDPGMVAQRYEAYEHAGAGDRAAGGSTFKINGVSMTSGELNALGDLYGTLADVKAADPKELQACVDLVRKQVADPKSVHEADWDTATNYRYSKLNMRNSSHFGPSRVAPPAGTVGPNNRATWESYYRQALATASAVPGGPGGGDPREDALLINSFAEHFLLDIFSAGHLFNKDDALATMTTKLTALNGGQLAGLLKTVATGTWAAGSAEIQKYQGHNWLGWWAMSSASRWQSVLEEVYKEPEGKLALQGAVVKYAHDKLSEGTVEVKNAFKTWNLSGDKTLSKSPDTQEQIKLALEEGRSRIRTVASAPGAAAPENDNVAAVVAHFPEPTGPAQSIIDKLVAAATDPAGDMAKAVTSTIAKEISAMLEGIAHVKPKSFRLKPP